MDDPWSRRTPPPSAEVRQRDDADAALRLTLVGEIDMAAADYLTAQIARLTGARRPVRLDLSQLRFIDCGGLDALVRAVVAARDAGCEFEVEPRVSAGVERIFRLAGDAPELWGAELDAHVPLRTIEPDHQNQIAARRPRRAYG